ncbi:MAG: hypothetical protein ACQCXQ_04440 [Verrucomicrobiales bacterium]|nr:hypothetical protein [Verrucomicrobiota bacterium JB025]
MSSEEPIPAEMLNAVEQQLTSPKTPYVTKTLARLVKSGLSESDAKIQIAIVLGEQMADMLKRNRPFNEKLYKQSLNELPMLPDEEEPA